MNGACLHVCATCKGGGAALAANLRQVIPDLPVRESGCLGPCGKAPRAALCGPGRWSWLFEGAYPDELAAFVAHWQATPRGLVEKRARAGLGRRIVGRMPPADGA